MKLAALNIRAKRDPVGAKHYLEGFYVAMVNYMGKSKALDTVLQELRPEYPIDCFPDCIIRDMWNELRRSRTSDN